MENPSSFLFAYRSCYKHASHLLVGTSVTVAILAQGTIRGWSATLAFFKFFIFYELLCTKKGKKHHDFATRVSEGVSITNGITFKNGGRREAGGDEEVKAEIKAVAKAAAAIEADASADVSLQKLTMMIQSVVVVLRSQWVKLQLGSSHSKIHLRLINFVIFDFESLYLYSW